MTKTTVKLNNLLIFNSKMPVKEVSTKLPSFLALLLQVQEDSNIKLVYQENEKTLDTNFKQLHVIDNSNLNISDVSDLDLTGSPLITDLGGQDLIIDNIQFVKPNSWTEEETEYGPMSAKTAQKYFRQALRSVSPRPIYCICDGKEGSPIVLGGWSSDRKFVRTMMFASLYRSVSDEITTMEYMKNDHLKTVRDKDVDINYLIYKNYYLYGHNLKNCVSLQKSEINGSISVEIFNNTNYPNCTNKDLKTMNCQVIVGHPKSKVYSYWQELCLIQSYVSILTSDKKNIASTVISSNPVDSSELIKQIDEIVNTANYMLKNSPELDLNNLRTTTILDRLWLILQHCETLEDLRDCFLIFFEELASREEKLRIIGDDQSTIRSIIYGLSEGKLAVPNVTFVQCLELLIELGLQKVKNDYFYIITNRYPISEKNISMKWKTLCDQNVVTNNSNELKRQTRITLGPRAAAADTINVKRKLLFIENMHVVVELLFLYSDYVHKEADFDGFCESVIGKYLVDTSNVIALGSKLKVPKLFELSTLLAGSNLDEDKMSLDAWSVKMKSVVGHSETITIFYFSVFPIIPDNIYSNQDIADKGIAYEKTYFVTKLNQFTTNY